jgi:sphinganine-1-phosphate aldolase
MREHGLAGVEILADLELRQGRDPSDHGNRLFGLVYPTARPDLEALIGEVNRRYLFGNALNPFKFVELANLEREVVESVGALLHVPDDGGGSMTSGGTESILMSMLVNRGRARARGVERPEILAPISAHPAYAKAAHYLDMDVVRVPLDADFRADVNAAGKLIGPSTAVVIASAFN